MDFLIQISDLTPLRDNPHYRNVDDVYLDNNIIESIDLLEGGLWLDRFRLLNLQNNLLKKVNNLTKFIDLIKLLKFKIKLTLSVLNLN